MCYPKFCQLYLSKCSLECMASPICYKESVFSIATTVSQMLGRFVMEIVSIRIKSNGAFQTRGVVPRLDQLRFSFHRWYSRKADTPFGDRIREYFFSVCARHENKIKHMTAPGGCDTMFGSCPGKRQKPHEGAFVLDCRQSRFLSLRTRLRCKFALSKSKIWTLT